jgi:hypothetical protein
MNNYTIYFEIFGKKMKTEINAQSEVQAIEKLKEKIIVHRVQETALQKLKNIFGI